MLTVVCEFLKKKTKFEQFSSGSTMLEDVVAPARATLVAHGQIGTGQHATDAAVAVKGVLRTPQVRKKDTAILKKK